MRSITIDNCSQNAPSLRLTTAFFERM